MTVGMVLVIFAATTASAYLAMAGGGGDAAVRRRLLELRQNSQAAATPADLQAELQAPLMQRLFEPLAQWFYAQVLRLTPTSVAARTRLKLQQAGVSMDVNHFVGMQALIAFGGALFVLLAVSPVVAEKPAVGVLLAAIVVFVGWRIPDFGLSKKIATRHKAFERALPDVLDLLCVSVEAGLGFDGAAQKVSEKFPEPVSGEFREYLKSVRLGASRAEALRAFSDRVELADVRTFTAAIIQADQLGVSIGKVLRGQSEAMRVKRKQRIEEKAMQLPLKLLFPLILFIFPTIFIVVLGPVIIQFLTVFTRR